MAIKCCRSWTQGKFQLESRFHLRRFLLAFNFFLASAAIVLDAGFIATDIGALSVSSVGFVMYVLAILSQRYKVSYGLVYVALLTFSGQVASSLARKSKFTFLTFEVDYSENRVDIYLEVMFAMLLLQPVFSFAKNRFLSWFYEKSLTEAFYPRNPEPRWEIDDNNETTRTKGVPNYISCVTVNRWKNDGHGFHYSPVAVEFNFSSQKQKWTRLDDPKNPLMLKHAISLSEAMTISAAAIAHGLGKIEMSSQGTISRVVAGFTLGR